MRTKRATIGTIVKSKVDDKFYAITEGFDGSQAILAEADPDNDYALGEGRKVLTEQNSICFRVIKDAVPETAPEGYTVEDGQLMLNGEPACEQGEIVLTDILYVGTKNILVQALGGIFYTYNYALDNFEEIYRLPEDNCADEIQVCFDAEKRILLVQQKEIVKITVNEIEQEVQVFVDGIIIVLNEAGRVIMSLFTDMWHNLSEKVLSNDGILTFIPVNNIKLVTDDVGDEWRVIDDNDTSYKAYSECRCERTLPETEIREVTYCPYLKGYMLRTDKAIKTFYGNLIVAEKPANVKKLADYPILVDITSKEDDETTYTFANADYETVTVTRKVTTDRGVIETLA